MPRKIIKERYFFLKIAALFIFILLGGGFAFMKLISRQNVSDTTGFTKMIFMPQTPSIIKVSQEIIRKKENGTQRSYLVAGEAYYYELGGENKIIFQLKQASPRKKYFFSGDIILKTQEDATILLDNLDLFGTKGETFSVYKTSLENIFLIKGEDVIYYFDLDKKAIVFSLKDNQGAELEMKKQNFPPLKIGLKITDECRSQSPEKKAEVLDLTINEKPANILEKSIPLRCKDVKAENESNYLPQVFLQARDLNSNFSQMAFLLKGAFLNEEIWRMGFSLDFSDFEKTILKNDPETALFNAAQVNFIKLFTQNRLMDSLVLKLPEPGTKLSYSWEIEEYLSSWWEEKGTKSMPMIDEKTSLGDFFYLDLDSDGKEEVVLNLWDGSPAGNSIFQAFRVLPEGDMLEIKINRGELKGYPYLFSFKEEGEMGHFRITFRGKKIIEYGDVYQQDDAPCCPSGGARFVVFIWDKAKEELAIADTKDILPQEMDENFNPESIIEDL